MKVKDIKLVNFAKYDEVKVSFDDNVTYLIGKNGAGKSTLGLTAIWFMFQGIAEKAAGGNNPLIGERFRFIGPKQATAKGEMTLIDEKSGSHIKVIRKLTKSGTELSFEAPKGMQLSQQWLTDLFNVFLIAPKTFSDLTPKEQAKALGIDTSKIDAEMAQLKVKFTEINAVLRAQGELKEQEKVERVDLDKLQFDKAAIRNKLNVQYLDNKKKNDDMRKEYDIRVSDIRRNLEAFNNLQAERTRDYNAASDAVQKLISLGYKGSEAGNFVEELKKKIEQQRTIADYAEEMKEPEYIVPEIPDDTELVEIDKKIAEASAINQAALLYEQYEAKKLTREQKEKELAENKKKQADKELERINYIKGFNFPVPDLTVGDGGELLLQGKPIKEPYFSTGELLRLIPNLFVARNPELKYVFLQDFNLLDEDTQALVENDLTKAGFQLVVELVGSNALPDKNCILLRDNVVVKETV